MNVTLPEIQANLSELLRKKKSTATSSLIYSRSILYQPTQFLD